MTHPPSSHDEESLEVGEELTAYLHSYNARLVHTNGAVAIEVAGQVEANGDRIAFRLVPDRGVLARILKWRKLAPDKQLSLLHERLNESSVAEVHADVRDFVAQILARAEQHKLDGHRFLGALNSGRELVSRRFLVVEDRLNEAIHQQRERAQAKTAVAVVPLGRYPESFELASQMRRRFIAVLGPTNSGKTHQAMEALSSAKTGVYLAPLRLLALENYERLHERGVAVSLITGEERRIREGATHIASTIEMLDPTRAVEVTVIDEVQMLEDMERGWAWTQAVCGAPAQTVYLLGSLTARDAVVALAERLGCELELKIVGRKSPLEMEDEPVKQLGRLRPGDAVIAFSRRDVLAWASLIAKNGMRVATIYGNLSPEVRRAQAQRFREGEADVVVATDAIGMGLNMPIARVVFTTAKKFDGISEDILPVWLAHQIAGRAGRYGIHEAGAIAGFDDATHRLISRLIRMQPEPLADRGFFVTPSLQHLSAIAASTRETSLAKLLAIFTRNIDLSDDFFLPADLTEPTERAHFLDTLPLSLEDKFVLSLVPVSTRVDMLENAWQSWARAMAKERPSYLQVEPLARARYPLQAAEDACKKYSAYAWLGYRLPDYFPDAEAAVDLARATSEEVDRMLDAQNSAHPPRATRIAGERQERRPAGHLRRHRGMKR